MLTKKMLRDMGQHKTQMLSVFLMAFLAVFIYTGVGSEWRGIQNSADNFYRETNLADAFLFGNGFSDEQADIAANIPGVSAVERRLELNASADIGNSPTLKLYFVEKNEISKLYLVSGSAFDKEDAAGIWLDKRFADAHSLSVGSEISLSANGISIVKTIRGLIYSSEQVYRSEGDALVPNFANYGYAYLSAKAFPIPAALIYNTLLIKASDTAGLEDKIDGVLNGKYSVCLERRNLPSVIMLTNEIQQHKMMGNIFPIVFLMIALLTIMTTMTRIVDNQRTQIGTLKALGFKKSVITRHYITYGFSLSLLGAAVGLITGPISLPYFFYPSMSSFYTLPEWEPAYAAAFLVVSGASVALCACASWLACRNLLRNTPADTLRPKSPKTFRHNRLEYVKLWRKLDFNAQWNIRDATRNPIRSLMAIIGVFGCTGLVVCALCMKDGMNDLKIWNYEIVNLYESKITLEENVTQEQIENITALVNGEPIMESRVEIRAKGIKKSASILVTDNTTLIHPTDTNLNPTSFPNNGIAITKKIADVLNLNRGDSIKWHIYGYEGWQDGKITAIYRDPDSQGIAMTKEHFESFNMTFTPSAIISPDEVSGDIDGAESVLSSAESVAGWDALSEALNIMTYLLLSAAAVLSVVVLYNLGLLSFIETEREMATLKVIGLKSAKLRGLLLTQNLWFTAIGFVFGVPGGVRLASIIASFSGDEFDFPISLRAPALVTSLVFTFGLSVLVNLMFSRKIRRLNMVESLKAME
ncbi:MAG: ABC transporter permease [Oscillospiraceae bacterium]|jgi:putative ABC transport system permease protein|nr:ABC transporter permease [Oscillospiraceae bacterium]